ncbi:MAG: type II toxin-antitoxin system Phd/YefM family antitoxin [Anaerolineae bacterium]
MKQRAVSATEARIRFGELMRRVVETEEPIIVERGGEPHVVVLSVAEYERLQRAQPRQGWRQPLERAVEVGARVAARRGGHPLTPPEEVVCQAREERDVELARLR